MVLDTSKKPWTCWLFKTAAVLQTETLFVQGRGDYQVALEAIDDVTADDVDA